MIKKEGKNLIGAYMGPISLIRILKGTKLVWEKNSSLQSCFAAGYWIDNYPWTDNLPWKD